MKCSFSTYKLQFFSSSLISNLIRLHMNNEQFLCTLLFCNFISAPKQYFILFGSASQKFVVFILAKNSSILLELKITLAYVMWECTLFGYIIQSVWIFRLLFSDFLFKCALPYRKIWLAHAILVYTAVSLLKTTPYLLDIHAANVFPREPIFNLCFLKLHAYRRFYFSI